MAWESHNEVLLVGRLAAPAVARELPSGDMLVSWRMVVDRQRSRRPVPEGVRRVSVDTLDCVAWSAGVRRASAGWAAGDVLTVRGSLQRRFWHGGGGLRSRYEVEVLTAKRVERLR